MRVFAACDFNVDLLPALGLHQAIHLLEGGAGRWQDDDQCGLGR